MTPQREVAETRMAQSVQAGQELQPEHIGELVVQGVQAEQFLILPDASSIELIRRRAQNRPGVSPTPGPGMQASLLASAAI